MPYRRLPNTENARLKAMETALRKTDGLPPFQLPFSVSTYQELKYFLPEFKQAIAYQRETLERQTEKQNHHQDSIKKARLYISHFIQVLNFAILRGELKTDTRKIFGLDEDERKLPQLNSEKDLIEWGKKIIDGEQVRMMNGLSPITNPNIARVKVHYEEFLRTHQSQKYLQDAHGKAIQKTSDLRDKADDIILRIWNEVEAKFKDYGPEEKRRQAAAYGIVYVYRKHERLSFKNLKLNVV
jgi:hypothetical protein